MHQIYKIFCFLLLFILSHQQVLAEKKSYIVYLGGHSHGPQITSADLERVTNSHVNLLSSFVGSKEKAKDVMFYSYQRHINGFAAILEEEEAANIAKHPGVVSVFPNGMKKLHTSHSWDFLGLEKHGVSRHSSLWKETNYGENIIIGHIDTGVWPESESFDDSGYGPVPSKWKGKCINETKLGVRCNKKVIGARYFIKGNLAMGGKVPSEQQTPRDYDGHGTHTLSTSGGNNVKNGSIFGVSIGTIKGGSPKARLAMYKACWDEGCFDADILQSFDYAIDDGVDVISVSLGGSPSDYYEDVIAIGSFHAMMKNIVVSASAGNEGYHTTVSNIAPWMITVGASTLDREFSSALILPNGDKFKLEGNGISKPTGEKKNYPLIYGKYAKAVNASFFTGSTCEVESMDTEKLKGKILVCLGSDNIYGSKTKMAIDSGAVGIIFCSADPGDIVSRNFGYSISAVYLSYKDGVLLFKYMNSATQPTAYITDTYATFGIKPAPVMADFSSSGPNLVTPDILKPDITAPGVGIIASISPGFPKVGEEEGQKFGTLSGTSMSCPHVAGVVGLLKKLHPDWSPAAIRSALMTTARSRDNIGNPMTKSSDHLKTTPLDYGAGHIQPNRAANPGLVYDLTLFDYLNFLCASRYTQQQITAVSGALYTCPENVNIHDFNYPSITVADFTLAADKRNMMTLTRKVKNVGDGPATYSASIRNPAGVSVTVHPNILKFEKTGDERTFKLSFKVNGTLTSYVYGHLIWSDSHGHIVRSPIVLSSGMDL